MPSSLSTLRRRFPQERSDHIVDSLASRPLTESQRAALLSCNLVSRAFCQRARRHFFYRIEIHERTNLLQCLLGLVSILTWSSGESPQDLGGVSRYIMECSFGYTKDRPNLDEIFHNPLANIFRLLHGPSNGIRFLEFSTFSQWETLSPDFQTSLLDLIRSPFLETLQLGDIIHLDPAFLIGSHIKHLQLYSPHMFSYRALIAEAVAANIYPHLETLDIYAGTLLEISSLDTSLVSALASSRIKTFSTAIIDASKSDVVCSMLKKHWNCVERIDFQIVTCKPVSSSTCLNNAAFDYRAVVHHLAPTERLRLPVPFCMDFHEMKNLQHLGLKIAANNYSTLACSLQDLQVFVMALKSPAYLKVLNIDISINSTNSVENSKGSFQYHGTWANLDSALSTTFASAKISFKLYLNPSAVKETPETSGVTLYGPAMDTYLMLRSAIPLLSRSHATKLHVTIAFCKVPLRFWRGRKADDIVYSLDRHF